MVLLVLDGLVVVAVTAFTPGPLDAGTYQDNPFGVPLARRRRRSADRRKPCPGC